MRKNKKHESAKLDLRLLGQRLLLCGPAWFVIVVLLLLGALALLLGPLIYASEQFI